ncbi:uncharacterized protein LOC121561987 [Coregonus clupeaformis]|uniref:uncharacterized protein LOC121561987 n=1 Tax=Coregonus clupeaformis TaxID=59861 RepID=UPI001E1C485C|nr:uncharacterized protein LOC121561987 [Coregonus clupeaformis]
MLKRQFCMLKAQGRLPLDLPLRPMKDWLLAGKRVFLEREAETWKRWRKVSVAELTWDAKRGLELQETETEIVILLSGQRVQDELRIPNVIVDTAPDRDIQLLKEERWKLNFLHLKDETCLATELYGHSETSSKETLIEEKRPKTKCPASVAGAADIDNTNEEASVESPNNNVVDVQAEPLALVGVEKEAAGDGKVLSKVVKPKVWLKEGCKDQLTRKFYDMIAELPKSYFGSTESLPEMCGSVPEVCSRVPEVCSRGPEVCRRGPEVCRRVPEVRCRGPEVRCRGAEVLSTGPEVCSGVSELSNAVGEVSSDTKKTEATGALLNTGNGLRKVVQLSNESRPEVCSSPGVCIRVPEVFSGGPEVCSGVPDMCSGVPEVFNGGPEVCRGSPEVFSEVPEAPNAVEEVSSDKNKTAAAENLLDTENVLSKVVNPKGWLKEGWEDQLHRDFNNMITKLPKSYFGSTESLPEVCSRGPEASNAVEEVCSDTKKTEATVNLLKTGNGLCKVVQLSTENRPEVCSSPEVCIRVTEVFSGGPEVCSGVPDMCSGVPEVFSGGPEVCSGVPNMCSGVPEVFNGGPEVCRGSPEVFSEVSEAPNAVEEVSSDKKKTAAAENLLDTENVLSKVVNPKGWLKEDWEDQLSRDFNNTIVKLPKPYFGSTERLPEVSIGVPEVLNAVEEVCIDTKKTETTGDLLNTGNGLSKVMQLSTESCPEVSSGVTEALNSVAKVSSEIKKRKKNGVLRFFRRVWKFFTCTISLPKEE